MAAPAPTEPSLPSSGAIAEQPLPRVLLELERRRVDGTLRIESRAGEAHITLHRGAPVDAGAPGEGSLCDYLARRGTIRSEQARKASGLAASRDCPEAKALLGLKILAPRDLLLAMRARLRESVVACLGLEEGRFSLDAKATAPDGSDALRIELAEAVHATLVAQWRPDRMLADLRDRLGQHVAPGPRFEGLATVLPRAAGVNELLAGVDGSRDAWSLIANATASEKIAALWVLDVAGALTWSDAAMAEQAAATEETEDADPADETAADEAPEIEIVLADAGVDSTREASKKAAANAAKSAANAKTTDAMRKEILARHASLREADLYAVLEVERDASLGQIKRAYLHAAKRLHPDALARLDLDDVKAQANEVFALITRAHETLSDDDARCNYDAGLAGHAEVDANQLAQAEGLFIKGEVMMKAGQFNDALDYLEAAVSLWPEECAYQSGLGWTLFKKAPPEDARAREHLEKALSLGESDAQTHLRLGVVLKALGDMEASAHHTARAKALDPAARA